MKTMTEDAIEEPLVPELPELADDGSVGTDEDVDLLATSEGPDAVGLDDSLLADDSFDEPVDLDDEASFLGDEEADLDVGDDDRIADFEEGYLDDAPSPALDVGFDVPDTNDPVVGSDVGQEGLDEPIVPRSRGEDEVELPPLDRSGSDEADDLDVGTTLILPS